MPTVKRKYWTEDLRIRSIPKAGAKGATNNGSQFPGIMFFDGTIGSKELDDALSR